MARVGTHRGVAQAVLKYRPSSAIFSRVGDSVVPPYGAYSFGEISSERINIIFGRVCDIPDSDKHIQAINAVIVLIFILIPIMA